MAVYNISMADYIVAMRGYDVTMITFSKTEILVWLH
jgi:hypothetical protein